MKHKYGLVIITFFLALGACRQPKDLVYLNVQDFRLMKAGRKQTAVGMDVSFYNPNNYSLKVKDGYIDVYMNGNHLGQAVIDGKYKIPRKDTFLLPVILNVDMQQLIPNSVEWIMNKQLDIVLHGNVRTGKGGVYINMPVNYEGKQELNIE